MSSIITATFEGAEYKFREDEIIDEGLVGGVLRCQPQRLFKLPRSQQVETNLLPTLVEEIDEGDVVEFFTNDRRLVVDVRENSYMNGCWFECADYSALFYEYGNKVNLVVDA